jgi:hypothetical protein
MRTRILLAVVLATSSACAAEVESEEPVGASLRVDGVERDSLGRALGSYSASIVKMNLAAERDLHLLARVEVRPDEIIEWYELGPGLILVSGAGMPVGDAHPEPEEGEDDPAAVWAAATNDAPMPRALRDALAREPERTEGRERTDDADPETEAHAPARDQGAAPAAADEHENVYKHLNLGWCDSAYYTESVSGYGTLAPCMTVYNDRECWDHVTGFYAASNDDCLDHRSNVCPYRGNIRMTIEADEGWITTGAYVVPEQSYRWKKFRDSYCQHNIFDDCPYVRIKVDQADGDGYQYRFLCNDNENF